MSPPATSDDHLGHPPPSAQQTSYVSAASRSNSTSASGVIPRRNERVSNKPTPVATRTAPASTRAPSSAGEDSSGSPTLHHDHIPPTSHMNPSPASQTAAKSASTSGPSVHPPPLTAAGVPSATRTLFGPWNSSSTGHQRAENRLSGSTSWRQSRSLKLTEQYKGGLGGGKRVADTVGAGSKDFGRDGRKANGGWEKGAKGLRTGGQKSLAEVWGKSKASTTAKRSSQEEKHIDDDALGSETLDSTDDMAIVDEDRDVEPDPEVHHLVKPPEKQIFRGLCFYINGSTMPLISDHKLKYVLTAHGASQSIALGRRTVTHVILGTTCGGGLAGSKLHKEITKTRGNAVKYITVEWVLESIKAERRLPESRFSPLKLAPKGQNGVFAAMRPGTSQPPA